MRIAEKQVAEPKSSRSLAGMSVISVHRNTSVYIRGNEVEPRLGRNIAVYKAVILLTISQTTLEYITRHPHPPPSNEL